MSDTPRTDKWVAIESDGSETVPAHIARQLEREIAEARAEIDALRMGKRSPCNYYFSRESEENLYRDLAEARADLRIAKNIIETHVERVAERDKLIEQMREQIIAAIKEAGRHFAVGDTVEILHAALRAADGGE